VLAENFNFRGSHNMTEAVELRGRGRKRRGRRKRRRRKRGNAHDSS
jgi:hypothetical protein